MPRTRKRTDLMDVVSIKEPSFLKDLGTEDLESLAREIRSFLINSLSKTGGHFSSNMGVVELTIALHKVFDSPKDQLIFDVGHQGYVHKILTGRAGAFDSLRQTDGLSGFLKRNESVHDCYEAGHSSTSIAAAAGMLFAKPHNADIGNIIALIGDGSLNSGAALEALNFLGHYPEKNPIIILNDNEMSITENVGHLSRMLTQIRMRRSYRSLRRKTSRMIPKRLRPFTSKVEKRIKGFLTGPNYFEALGYDYYGPLDGHSFKHLIKALENAKRSNKPTVIHVRTKKGCGYTPSEADKEGLWHGVKPFDAKNGAFHAKPETNVMTYSGLTAKYLHNHASTHPDFYVITPAMVGGSELNDFKKTYPDRLIDTGIAEATSVTMGGSLAMKGVRPFLSIYSTFLQRAYDQVIHDVARQKAGLIIGIDRAGLVGGDGETHQGIYDIPMLSHVPNMTIAHPKDGAELYRLLDYAFKIESGPIAVRYPRAKDVFDASMFTQKPLDMPSWETLHEGSRGTIIAFGDILKPLNEAIVSNKLDVTLINARFIKPLDKRMLLSLKTDKPILTYEESTLNGGLGQMVLSKLYQMGRRVNAFKALGFDDTFVPHGDREAMLKRYGLDVESVIDTMREMIDDAP